MDDRTRGAAIGVTALLAVALIGGVAGAQGSDATPRVIELVSSGNISEAATASTPEGGVGSTLLKERLLDADGQEVGTAVWHCTSAEEVAWVCEAYLDLGPGAYTADGAIVAQGLFEGFSGESLAVIGGTGAYADARGEATLAVVDDAFTWHLELMP